MREWVLADQTHHFLRQQRWEVAVLPFGATEPHNLHMPYGTDNFQVEEIGSRASPLWRTRRMHARGMRAVARRWRRDSCSPLQGCR